jgi:hypothetical protein
MTGSPHTAPADAQELCHYFLDGAAVRAWLSTQMAQG